MLRNRKSRVTTLALFTSAAALATACGRVSVSDGTDRIPSDLVQAQSCDHLLQMIRDDATRKIDAQADAALRGGPYGYGMPAGVGGAGGGFDGAGGTGGGGLGGPPVSQPTDHSTTNNQVAGVEEADIVQSDGERLWLLHGSELQVLRTWPPQSLAVTSSLPIEGAPLEMIVSEGRAVIFSQTWSESSAGDAAPCYDGGGGMGGMGCGAGVASTKITVVALDGEAPRVEREAWIDADYRSARGHGSVVRAIVSGGHKAPPETYPDYEYGAWYGAATESEWARSIEGWRARAVRAVAAAPLDAWLPVVKERRGAAVEELAHACTSYFAPPPGHAGNGLTSVLALDLAAPTAPVGGASVLGATSVVQASKDALVLAHPEYFDSWNGGAETTTIHRFDLGAGGGVTYAGSGAVPGHVLNQFSLDEHRGIIRVATTETTETADLGFTTVTRVLTLAAGATGLDVVGSTEPLAPGERVYSARFLGDRGYVVTFRQVDPLFVVDLADPTAPTVLGELKIPGFSEYLHPLGDQHLLTIGRDLDEDGVGTDRLALQIFDVSDPVAPALAHKHVFVQEGYSEASYDHRAFTYFAARGLLAFPFQAWTHDGSRASLEVFGVDTKTGFTARGAVAHTGMAHDPACDAWSGPCYASDPQMRRGVFVDDYVYSISDAGVAVHALGDLTAPVAAAALPPAY